MTPPRHAEVEIRIFAKNADGRYPIQLTVNQLRVDLGLEQQEFPVSYLDGDGPERLAALPIAEVPAAMRAWLLPQEALQVAWAEIAARHPRRAFRLYLEAPELHALPWELARDRAGELDFDVAASDRTPLFRYLPGRQLSAGPVFDRPVRILVAAASPPELASWGLGALDVDAEVERVRAALAGAPPGEFEVVPLRGPTTLDTLEAALRGGIHVLHLAAHGLAPAGEAPALILDGADGKLAIVPDADLAARFASLASGRDAGRPRTGAGGADDVLTLRLVVLLACRSGAHAAGEESGAAVAGSAAGLRGVAPELVRAGVPAVVAMQDAVPQPTASSFASTFYTRLVEHGRVDLAVNEARGRLRDEGAEGGPRLPAFAIPCLYSRLPSGQLLGVRGEVQGGRAATKAFWEGLVDDVWDSTCIPFLGPRVAAGVIPAPEDIAETLASRCAYPFDDTRDLARVAESMSLIDREDLVRSYLDQLRRGLYTSIGKDVPTRRGRPAPTLAETAAELDWGRAVLGVQEVTVFHHLAEMPFPIYVTCDAHPLLEEALRVRGRTPVVVGPRWESAGEEQWLLPADPTIEAPLVLHLNGYDDGGDQREWLVLSEDDWFEQIIRLSSGSLEYLPMQVQRALQKSAILMLGFEVRDWAFRVLFHTLFRWLGANVTRKKQRLRLSVQLDASSSRDVEAGSAFLREYLRTRDIQFYPGNTAQFIAELADQLGPLAEE